MANTNNFSEAVESMFKGLDGFVTSKTVVGDAITVGDTVVVPLVDVSFGMGAGAFARTGKNQAGGGLGGKVTPTAVLVIKDGATKMISVKGQDVATKIVDMVPELINKFADKKNEPDVDLEEVLDEAKAQAEAE